MIVFRKIPFLLLAAVFALAAVPSAPAAHAGESKEITATGMGSGDRAKARDEAISDALRKAVEQGVGTYITSSTTVEQMMLVEDRIYSESRGFVESYDILSESEKDGVYAVKIRARVSMGKLEDELAAIGIIMKKKLNPRVMVIVRSRADSRDFPGFDQEGSRSAENLIESMMLAKGFRLVDAGQTARKRRLAAMLAGRGSANAAAKMAKDFGAEILVDVEVKRQFIDNRNILGRSMPFFTNDVRMKAIETDSARLLYSGFKTSPPSGGNATGIVETSARKLASEMMNAVLNQWKKDVYQAGTFRIEVKNANFARLNGIIAAIKDLRGMGPVHTRSFAGKEADLEVSFQGNLNELATRLNGIKDIEVTGLAGTTVTVTVRSRETGDRKQ